MKSFKSYKWGADFLGILLLSLLLLPNIVYWCMPEFTGLGGNTALTVICYLFGALGAAAMVALVRKEGTSPFGFFTVTGILTWLFLALDYLAWIFFFCGFNNIAVKLFLAIAPGACLISYQTGRKNWIAVGCTTVFALLYLLNIAAFAL